MRLLIVGNSGSGKSTYAERRARAADVPCLPLDGLVWEPHQIAVERPPAVVRAELRAFLDRHDRWVIEGCDGDLVAAALPWCSELLFLNPGVETCLRNNRARPWEPHKYDSPEAQQTMLAFLLGWVESYYARDDPRSLAYHRRVFDGFAGPKREILDLADLP